MNLLLLAIGLAQGGPPGALGLVAEPPGVRAAYAEAVAKRERKGDSANLDCRPAFDDVLFCLTLVTSKGWRYATVADLKVWGLDSESAHAKAADRMRALPVAARMKAQTIEGMPGKYYAARLDDGQDAAPLLAPDALAKHLGGPPVISVPAQGAVIAWVPGNAVLDKVVAVGVHRMYEEADHAVSPRIYRWSKEGWTVWGEVTKPQP